MLLSLVQSLVLTRLDYGNATLAGLSGRQTSVCSARRCSTDLLQTKVRAHNATARGTALHWLSAPERIQSNMHGTAPPYFADQLQLVEALESHRRLRSLASARLDVPRTRRTTVATVHSVLLNLACGTVCHHRHRMHLRCLYLGDC